MNGYTIRTTTLWEWGVFHPDWYEGKVPVFGSPSVYACIAWVVHEG